jgi:RNA polymerase sigma-70 factor, ECF subfamily
LSERTCRGKKGNSLDIGTAITKTVPHDFDVIRRAQLGDSEAFTCLFHGHKAKIYSLCLRMTQNVAEAEDLTQDTFVMVYRNISTFRGNSAFSTWLHRVTVNTVLMHFRKRSLRLVSLDEPCTDKDGAKISREYSVKDHRLEGCVDRVALASAIQDLPVGYRRTFLLHEIGGYKHEEIAKILDCCVGTSKSQLHKAKLRIRTALAHSRKAKPLARNPRPFLKAMQKAA